MPQPRVDKVSVCYLSGGSRRDQLFVAIATELAKKGGEASFICYGKYDTELVKRLLPDVPVRTILLHHPKGKHTDGAKLAELEKKYDFRLWQGWSITSPRRGNWKVPIDDIRSYFEYCVREITSFFDAHPPDCLVLHGIASYQAYLVTKIAASRGIRVVQIQESRFENRFVIQNQDPAVWPEIEEHYAAMVKKGLTDTQRKQAKTFLQQYRKKPAAPKASFHYKEPFQEKIKRTSKWFFKYASRLQIPPEHVLIVPILKKKYFDNRGYFGKRVSGEKYILFPLHLQPEVSTLRYGKWHVDQLAVVENLAKALPANYLLYVKEHRHMYGNRELNYYSLLRKNSNVRIIGPQENNFDLIKNSSGVATITGTSGWEALLLGKPTITFGDIFYNAYPQTIHNRSYWDLEEQIDSLLKTTVKEPELLIFIAAMYEASRPGLARAPGDCKDLSLQPENVRLLADGIHDYLSNHL